MGRGPPRARDHDRGAGRSPRSASSSGSRPWTGVTAAAVGRRGPARHPAGGGRRREPMPGRGGRAPRLAPEPLADAVRAAAGVDVAAVLRTARAAGRHPARLQDRPHPGRPLGRARAGGRARPGAGREGPGHRGERHARRRGRRRAGRPRRRRSRCCSADPPACGTARCSPTSPTPAAVRAAVAGHDAVVHLAAKVDIQGRYREFARTNVTGTRTWCRGLPSRRRAAGSCTSPRRRSRTPGARWSARPPGPADPGRARGHYARSKAVAERLALAADAAPDGPATVVVRPHLVWGPGDTQLVGRIVDRARAGRLPVIGSGAALIDTTYVDNAVDALVAALDRCDAARGQALVVSNGEPRPVAELLAADLPGGGRPAPAAARCRRSVARGGRRGGRGGRGPRCRAAARGRPADDPVPRRAAQHRALVRPAPHARGAGLDPARQHRGGLGRTGPTRRVSRGRPLPQRPRPRRPTAFRSSTPNRPSHVRS